MDKDAMRKEINKAKKWNIVIISVFAVIFGIIIIGVSVFKYQHTYSRFKWDTNKEKRYKIVGDMLKQNQLVGMTELDVIQLLGNEDNNDQISFKISKDYFPPELTLVYYLGVDFMDINWLVISLDNGIVTDYCIDVS